MVENYDLKTVNQQVTNTLTTLKDLAGAAIGAVPAGMKRYITFLKVTNTCGTAATLNIVMSIAASKFLVLQMANAGETADVTIGYYEK
jgi:hypothetical protein